MIKKILPFAVLFVLVAGCSQEHKKQDIKSVKSKQKIVIANKNVDVDKEFELFKKYRYFDYDRVAEAKYKVLKTGDKSAYGELELFFVYNKSKRFEMLPYSLIMVEKHKKYEKCSDVFKEILELLVDKELGDYYTGEDESLIGYLKNVEQLSKEQKDYAISYLKLGAKNDDYGCIKYLEILYRNGFGVSKDLKMANSLMTLKNDLEIKLGLHLSNKHS